MATLRFHVVPNAKADQVVGEHGAAIKVKLRAPPIEGKANAALRAFLSEQLRVPQRDIAIEQGHRSRTKLVRIEGRNEQQLRSCLLNAP
jgi:uncharacterized protein (TIGR00251 family)